VARFLNSGAPQTSFKRSTLEESKLLIGSFPFLEVPYLRLVSMLVCKYYRALLKKYPTTCLRPSHQILFVFAIMIETIYIARHGKTWNHLSKSLAVFDMIISTPLGFRLNWVTTNCKLSTAIFSHQSLLCVPFL
jgi:hypothetical protein